MGGVCGQRDQREAATEEMFTFEWPPHRSMNYKLTMIIMIIMPHPRATPSPIEQFHLVHTTLIVHFNQQILFHCIYMTLYISMHIPLNQQIKINALSIILLLISALTFPLLGLTTA